MANSLPYQHIMVWIDGTDSADRACRLAVDIARSSHAKITAVSVVDTETLGSLLKQRLLVVDEMQEFEVELAASAEKYLKNACELAAKAGVKMDTVLLKGCAHSGVLAEGGNRNADLIVMGTFNSADIRRDLAARGRQLVVDGAQCPVLLVR
jgi:nucleotide-binding universal stress UspA family protein